MADIKKLKKISTKDIMNLTEAQTLEIAKSKKQDLYVIGGDVAAYGIKPTTFGPAPFVLGTFVAQNSITGERFASSKAYLPNDAAENIMAMFDKRSVDDPVHFVMSVSVVESKKSKNGYTYMCEPVRDTSLISREAELVKLLPPPPKK